MSLHEKWIALPLWVQVVIAIPATVLVLPLTPLIVLVTLVSIFVMGMVDIIGDALARFDAKRRKDR